MHGFTPSPWIPYPDDPTYLYHPEDESAKTWIVCRVYGQPGCPNSCLIETAPELFETIKNIRDTIESCYVAGGWVSLDAEEMEDIRNMANAIIAKIERGGGGDGGNATMRRG